MQTHFIHSYETFWQQNAIDWETCKVVIFRRVYNCIYFHKVREFNIIESKDLLGVKNQITLLDSNTQAFLSGKKASNALLWGARGCGKSSVVKAVLGRYIISTHHFHNARLRIIEIDSKDIEIMPLLFDYLREWQEFYFIIFCDDLTFHSNQHSYSSIKSVLEGSFEIAPKNVLLYATSNLRHIIHEETQENTLHTQDNIHEMLSFSDRFPLNIGFYAITQEEYLSVLENLVRTHLSTTSSHEREAKVTEIMQNIKQKAINFATKIGNRSPRTAKDFFTLYCNDIKC